MGRRRKGNKVDGWINFHKPVGMTSTQAVGKVRWMLNAQKAGHAGTLDPLASGILPIALGEATKTIAYAQDAMKIYSFSITWGEQRDTDDNEGEVIATSDIIPTREDIQAALPAYIGEIQQVPPKYSAIKVDGERAYDLARDGEDFQLHAREVYIETLELLNVEANTADFRMLCGKGTYVRALARDLAQDLGTVGYISALRRDQVGAFTLDNAISLDKLEEMGDSAARMRAVLPLESSLDDIPALPLREDEAAKLRNGQRLSFISRPDFERLNHVGDAPEALAVCNDNPVALVEIDGAEVRSLRVFNL